MSRVAHDVGEAGTVPSVVTIGFFDGVHRGHQAIVAATVGRARADRLRAVAVTFDRHPQEVLAPGSQPRYLMPLGRRVATLLGLGLDLVVVQPFTLDFSEWSPQRFVDDVLAGGLGARHVVVGSNFRFGHRARGTVAMLETLAAAHGIGVEHAAVVGADGEPVSSTLVRRLLDIGDVEAAVEALGRPYWLDGIVARGEGRGRTIGIPTANLATDERMQVPATGVYAAWATLDVDVDGGVAPRDAARLPAVVNIGNRPTFRGRRTTVEAHLLDRDDHDLYGRRLSLGFVHRLRDEQRFEGPAALVAQIRADIEAGRGLLAGDRG